MVPAVGRLLGDEQEGDQPAAVTLLGRDRNRPCRLRLRLHPLGDRAAPAAEALGGRAPHPRAHRHFPRDRPHRRHGRNSGGERLLRSGRQGGGARLCVHPLRHRPQGEGVAPRVALARADRFGRRVSATRPRDSNRSAASCDRDCAVAEP
eukprot:2678517-Prymnesium_polylepis.2